MIRIKGRVATYGEVWYDEPIPDHADADVLMFRQRSTPIVSGLCVGFLSLVNDLSKDAVALSAACGKDNRYKIRRAETKDDLKFRFFPSPAEHLEQFASFYDDFAEQKALKRCYRRGLTAACEANQLVLTQASHDDEILVWHAYMTFGNTAGLLHSASHFRGRDSNDRAMIGRANRWLHWRDLLQFKEIGLARYDWGGLFEDDTTAEHAGINRFKEEFGGSKERTYNCTLPLTIKGRLYVVVSEARKRWMRG